MRNHGLFAFALTTGVLVPAAAHYLTAGHDQVVKFAAGTSDELALGTALIEAKLEHPLVDPGEPLRIKLSASSAKGKRLEVGLLVYGSSGDEGARVPSPPVGVAHKTVTIPIDAAGNGSTEIAIPLKGARSNQFSPEPFTSYEVLVMSPRAATKMEGLRRGARLIGGKEGIPWYNKTGDKFQTVYGGWNEKTGEDIALFAEGAVVRLDAHTRSINPAVAIETPPTIEVGRAFTVAVTVKNPTKKAVKDLEVLLSTPSGLIENTETTGTPARVLPEKHALDLAAGESRRLEFRVTSDKLGVLGLYAHVVCHGEDCDEKNPITKAGTFDATEIVKKQQEVPSIVVGQK